MTDYRKDNAFLATGGRAASFAEHLAEFRARPLVTLKAD